MEPVESVGSAGSAEGVEVGMGCPLTLSVAMMTLCSSAS